MQAKESGDFMKKKSFIAIVLVTLIIFAGQSYVWASDFSNLINTKFFDSSIEKAISEGALSGHYGNLNKAIYYLNSESKPDQKAALDFIAWINLVNASRMLAVSYRDSEGILNDSIRSKIEEESRQIDAALLDVGKNRLGWNETKIQEMYDTCRKSLEKNLSTKSIQKPTNSAVSKPSDKTVVTAITVPQDRIVGTWKADIEETIKLPEVKEFTHFFEKGEKLYPWKWTTVEITDKQFDLSFSGGKRFKAAYKVASKNGREVVIELENDREQKFKLEIIDDTHLKLSGPQGMVMVFKSLDKSKEEEDPEESAFIVYTNNVVAESILRGAYTAQQAYYADHMTFAKSIEDVKNVGFNLSDGVSLSIIDANVNELTMEAFHDKGDKIFIVNQDGEIKQRMINKP